MTALKCPWGHKAEVGCIEFEGSWEAWVECRAERGCAMDGPVRRAKTEAAAKRAAVRAWNRLTLKEGT